MSNIIEEFEYFQKESKQNETRLIRQYFQALIDKEVFFKRSELKKRNIIDLRPLFNLNIPNKNGKVNSYDWPAEYLKKIIVPNEGLDKSSENFFFKLVPCFEEAVLQVNTDRYIYYKILNLDIEQSEYTIFLQSCSKQDYMGWILDAECQFTLDIRNEEFSYKSKYILTESEIAKIINPIDLGWNKKDIQLWERFNSIYKPADEKTFDSIVKWFIKAIYRTNLILEKNKVSTKRKSMQHKKDVVIDNEPDKRRVRTVGEITIISDKIPKAPSFKSVVHYKTAVWTVRSHTRTLKNGKTIYIKEHVHHRQALKERGETTPKPITIKVRESVI